MKELIERLRRKAGQYDEYDWHSVTELEAADALERLTTENTQLKEIAQTGFSVETNSAVMTGLGRTIQTLTAERDALKEGLDGWHARYLDAEVDAERYRWLRDGLSGPLAATDGMTRMARAFGEFDDTPSAEQFDAAIDAAIAGERHDF